MVGNLKKVTKHRALFDYYGRRVDYGDGDFPSVWPTEIEQVATGSERWWWQWWWQWWWRWPTEIEQVSVATSTRSAAFGQQM